MAKCVKCGGNGHIAAYNHIQGGICFKCAGTGVVEAAANGTLGATIAVGAAVGAAVYAGKKIVDKLEEEERMEKHREEINKNHTLTAEEEDYFKELLGDGYNQTKTAKAKPIKNKKWFTKTKSSKQTLDSQRLAARMPR